MKNITIKEVKENPANFKICRRCYAINSKDNICCAEDTCNCRTFNEDVSEVTVIIEEEIEFFNDGSISMEEIENKVISYN